MQKKYLIVDKKQRVKIESTHSYTLTRLKEEAEKNGDLCDIVYLEDILFSKVNNYEKSSFPRDISEYSHAIIRGHNNQEQYRNKKALLGFLRATNPTIKIQNEKAYDKFATYSKLEQLSVFLNNSIATPKTYYPKSPAESNEEIMKNCGFSFPIIAKHIYGENRLETSQETGQLTAKKNIFLIKQIEDFGQLNPLQDYFFQEFIPSGKDFRAYVKNNQVIAMWQRQATTSFITVSQGLYSFVENPSSQLVEISKKVAKAIESDFVAVDIMEKDGKPLVLEVNLNPGIKAFETKVLGHSINLARVILESF